MKFKPASFSSFVQNLSDMKAVLAYGPDTGAASEIIQKTKVALLKKHPNLEVVPIVLDKSTPSAFWDEVNAISMFGSFRLLVIQNVPDEFIDDLDTFLNKDTVDVFLALSSGTFKTTSGTVKLLEGSGVAGSFGCYPQEAGDIKQTIMQFFAADGMLIEPDALAFLSANLGADKGITLCALEKLKTYLGSEKRITLKDVEQTTGNGSAVSMDDLFMSVLSGQTLTFQKHFDLLKQEGIEPVALSRGFMRKVNQLLLVLSKIKNGTPVDTAIKSTPPFIPFKYASLWKQIVLAWPIAYAQDAFSYLVECERDCKTGLPADLILHRCLTRINAAGKKVMSRR